MEQDGKGEAKRALVRGIFGDIAPGYDAANCLMSLGRDRQWRRIVAARCALGPGDRALDLCCGTGELSLALAASAPGLSVVGLDFSPEMLSLARRKAEAAGESGRFEFVEGDATRLPFPEASFDAVTVGWGLRNVPDLDATVREMVRVARPGALVASIDMGHPAHPLIARAYWGISRLFVPAVGRLVAGNAEAYRYLHESSRVFIDQGELARRFRDQGLVEVRVRNFLGGAVALVEGRKPSS